MDFEALDIGNFQHLAEQRAHIREVRERALRIGIRLAAKNDIAVKRPFVKDAPGLALRLFDKLRPQRFRRVGLAGVDFEIGMNADGGLAHGLVIWG